MGGEERQKATKAHEDSCIKTEVDEIIQDLRNKIRNFNERLQTMENVHFKVAREVTALQQAVLDEDWVQGIT